MRDVGFEQRAVAQLEHVHVGDDAALEVEEVGVDAGARGEAGLGVLVPGLVGEEVVEEARRSLPVSSRMPRCGRSSRAADLADGGVLGLGLAEGGDDFEALVGLEFSRWRRCGGAMKGLLGRTADMLGTLWMYAVGKST